MDQDKRSFSHLMAELTASLDRIPSHVEHANAKLTQARENSRKLAKVRIIQEIAEDLGVITVDGFGFIVDISFDKRKLQQADKGLLGSQIAAAVRAADRKSVALRKALAARIESMALNDRKPE